MLAIAAPIRIVSEANRREHWAARHRRSSSQRAAIWAALLLAGEERPVPPLTVTMARIGPRLLDDDNLAGGFKAVRDAIAKWLGVDDGPTSRVEWRYEQRRGKRGEYWVEVRIGE